MSILPICLVAFPTIGIFMLSSLCMLFSNVTLLPHLFSWKIRNDRMEMGRHERHLKDLHLVNLVYLCYFLSFVLCLWNINNM